MSELKRYTQVCFSAGEDGATAHGFVSRIRSLMGLALPRWVAASDVDAAGPVRAEVYVATKISKVFQSDEYLDKLSQAEQIVWANLFFSADEERARSITGTEDYTQSLMKADFLARVVDAEAYCFYGPSHVLDDRFEERQSSAIEVIRGELSELEFPE